METASYLLSKNYSISENIYFFQIRVYTKKFGGDFIEQMFWSGYNLYWLTKWRWYFNYRAALLQIKYPRFYIETKWGSRETEIKEDKKILKERQVKKDITTSKRMITKYKNAIEKFEESERTKLIPNWENPKYLKAKETLNKYQTRLTELQNL